MASSPALEIGHQRGGQRADDVAADDVHAAVGQHPQRVGRSQRRRQNAWIQGASAAPGARSS